MKVYILGNDIVDIDALPSKLAPFLRKSFPQIDFVSIDPTENFLPEDGSLIIDVAYGLNEMQIFESVGQFMISKRVSVHDYDLSLHLALLLKLKKLNNLKLMTVPVNFSIGDALKYISSYLAKNHTN